VDINCWAFVLSNFYSSNAVDINCLAFVLKLVWYWGRYLLKGKWNGCELILCWMTLCALWCAGVLTSSSQSAGPSSSPTTPPSSRAVMSSPFTVLSARPEHAFSHIHPQSQVSTRRTMSDDRPLSASSVGSHIDYVTFLFLSWQTDFLSVFVIEISLSLHYDKLKLFLALLLLLTRLLCTKTWGLVSFYYRMS
jgi:hypothetical protein